MSANAQGEPSFRQSVDLMFNRAVALMDLSPGLEEKIRVCNSTYTVRFGVRLEHIDVVVPADNHGRGGRRRRRTGGRRSQQVGQLGVGIRGDHQSGIGSRRQPEAILDLLNSAFVRLAGATLEVTQAHDANPGCGGKIGQQLPGSHRRDTPQGSSICAHGQILPPEQHNK